MHPGVWQVAVPASSASAHLFLKSTQLLQEQGVVSPDSLAQCDGRSLFEELVWQVRKAFFCEALNIAEMDTLTKIAETVGFPVSSILAQIDNGAAMAAMCRDSELANEYKVDGSPTYILNAGRQKLYGNVGYKIIEANVHEVLHRPTDQATWC